LKNFLLGDGSVGGPEFAAGEIYFFSVIFSMGVLAFLSLGGLMFLAARTYQLLYKKGIEDYQPLTLFIACLTLSTFHYNSIFRFPSIFYTFTFIGFLAGKNLKHSRNFGQAETSEIS